MKLILIFFLVGSCGLGEGMIKEYINISNPANWYDALNYCRQYNSDLASFNTTEEQQRIVEIFGNPNQPVWIGLYRQSEGSAWQWSDGEQLSFLTWYPGYPVLGYAVHDPKYRYIEQNCAYLYEGKWVNVECWGWYPFYCYRHLILVNESKTWEEALQYCNTHYTGFASLHYATQGNQSKKEIALTQTDSVWTSLRFMDGKWFWLRGETPLNLDSLSGCPARPYHCGAFNNNTYTLENRDCNEKLNFLCYQK